MSDAVSWCISACYQVCSFYIWILLQIVEYAGNLTIYILNDCLSKITQYMPAIEKLDEAKKCRNVEYPDDRKKRRFRLRTAAIKRRVPNHLKRTSNKLSKTIKFLNSELERNLERAKKVTITFEYSPESKKNDAKFSKTYDLFSSSQSMNCKGDSENFSEICNPPAVSNECNKTKLKRKQGKQTATSNKLRLLTCSSDLENMTYEGKVESFKSKNCNISQNNALRYKTSPSVEVYDNKDLNRDKVANLFKRDDFNNDKDQLQFPDQKHGETRISKVLIPISHNLHPEELKRIDFKDSLKQNDSAIAQFETKRVRISDEEFECFLKEKKERSFFEILHYENSVRDPDEILSVNESKPSKPYFAQIKLNTENLVSLKAQDVFQNSKTMICVEKAEPTACTMEINPIDIKYHKSSLIQKTPLKERRISSDKVKFLNEKIYISEKLKNRSKYANQKFVLENIKVLLNIGTEIANIENSEKQTRSINLKTLKWDNQTLKIDNLLNNMTNSLECENSKELEFPIRKSDTSQIQVCEMQNSETDSKITNEIVEMHNTILHEGNGKLDFPQGRNDSILLNLLVVKDDTEKSDLFSLKKNDMSLEILAYKTGRSFIEMLFEEENLQSLMLPKNVTNSESEKVSEIQIYTQSKPLVYKKNNAKSEVLSFKKKTEQFDILSSKAKCKHSDNVLDNEKRKKSNILTDEDKIKQSYILVDKQKSMQSDIPSHVEVSEQSCILTDKKETNKNNITFYKNESEQADIVSKKDKSEQPDIHANEGKKKSDILAKEEKEKQSCFLVDDENKKSDILAKEEKDKQSYFPVDKEKRMSDIIATEKKDKQTYILIDKKKSQESAIVLAKDKYQLFDISAENLKSEQSDIPSPQKTVGQLKNQTYTEDIHSEILSKTENTHSRVMSVAVNSIVKGKMLQPRVLTEEGDDTVSLINQSKENIKPHNSTFSSQKKPDSMQLNILLKDNTSNLQNALFENNSQVNLGNMKVSGRFMQSEIVFVDDYFSEPKDLYKKNHSEDFKKLQEKTVYIKSVNLNEESEKNSNCMHDKTEKHKAANYKDIKTLHPKKPLKNSENMSLKMGKKYADSSIHPKEKRNVREKVQQKKVEIMKSKLLKRNICLSETFIGDDSGVKSKILVKKHDSPQSKSLHRKSKNINLKIKPMKNMESDYETIFKKPHMYKFLQKKYICQKKIQFTNEKNLMLRAKHSQKSSKEVFDMVSSTDYYNSTTNSSIKNITGSNIDVVSSVAKIENKEMCFENSSLTSTSTNFLKNANKIILLCDSKIMFTYSDLNNKYSMQTLNTTDVLFRKNNMLEKFYQSLYDFQRNMDQTENYPVSRLPMYWDKMLTDGKCESAEKSKISIFAFSNDPFEIQNVVLEDSRKKLLENHDETITTDSKILLTKEHDCNKHTLYQHGQDVSSNTRDMFRILTRESNVDFRTVSNSSSKVNNCHNETENQKLNVAETKLKSTQNERFKAMKSSKYHKSLSNKSKSIGKEFSNQPKEIPDVFKSTTQTTLSKENLNHNVKHKNREKQNANSVHKFKTPNPKFNTSGDEITLFYPTLTADSDFLKSVRRNDDIKTCANKKLQPKKLKLYEEYLENRWNANDKIFYCNVMEYELAEEKLTNDKFCPKQSLGIVENTYDPMLSISPLCDGLSVKEDKFILGKRLVRCFSKSNEFSNASLVRNTGKLKIVKIPATSPPKRRRKFPPNESNSVKLNVECTAGPSKPTYNSSKHNFETKVPTCSQKIDNQHIIKEKSKINSKKTKSMKHKTTCSKTVYTLNDNLVMKTHPAENLPLINIQLSEVECMTSLLKAEYDPSEYHHKISEILRTPVLDMDLAVTESDDDDSKKTDLKLDWYEMTVAEEERQKKMDSGEFLGNDVTD